MVLGDAGGLGGLHQEGCTVGWASSPVSVDIWRYARAVSWEDANQERNGAEAFAASECCTCLLRLPFLQAS